jgi:sugar phosphate isomerase/epimerase
MQKIGVIHYNFPEFSLSDFLRYAEETGYEYVELAVADVWADEIRVQEKRAEAVRKEVDVRGLMVSALSAANDFIQLDEEAIQFQVDRMERVCALAQILGTDVIRTEGGQSKKEVPEQRQLEAMAGCLIRCGDFIERDEMLLAVDNHGLVTNDGDLQVALFEKVGSKRVGANLDTMNYRWFGHDLEAVGRFYEIIAPYTFHTHMKDGTGSRQNYVGVALGEGEIDLKKTIRCLRAAGYEGVFCSEYEGKEDSAVGYRKCYEYLREHV